MEAIEHDNPTLKGVLSKEYARPTLDKERLGQLIDLIGTIGLGDKENRSKDILGRVYEYFLGQFAAAEGRKAGQPLQESDRKRREGAGTDPKRCPILADYWTPRPAVWYFPSREQHMGLMVELHCPRCRARLRTAEPVPGKRLRCAKCGAVFTDDLPFAPDEPIAAAHQKTIDWLRNRGFRVHSYDVGALLSESIESVRKSSLVVRTSDPWNPRGLCLATCATVLAENDAGALCFVILPRRLSANSSRDVAERLMSFYRWTVGKELKVRFRYLSPYPLESILRCLFADCDAAEAERILTIQVDFPERFEREHARSMADLGQSIFEKLVSLDESPRNVIRSLETALLDSMRFGAPPDRPQPHDFYEPVRLLACLGCFYGRLIGSLPRLKFGWVPNAEYPFGISLVLGREGSPKQIAANPIGRVLRLYREGRSATLGKYAEEAVAQLG